MKRITILAAAAALTCLAAVPAVTSQAATLKPAATGATFGGGSQSYSCRRVLEVDDAGIVRASSSDGNGCCVAAMAGTCKSWVNPARPL